jgi:hypothetical protein
MMYGLRPVPSKTSFLLTKGMASQVQEKLMLVSGHGFSRAVND